MRRFHQLLLATLVCSLLAIPAFAASAKKYQVTGTITALTDDVITVAKPDGEKFEIDRDAKTAVTGELKVGGKVTVMYTMAAATIDVKAATTRPAKTTAK